MIFRKDRIKKKIHYGIYELKKLLLFLKDCEPSFKRDFKVYPRCFKDPFNSDK